MTIGELFSLPDNSQYKQLQEEVLNYADDLNGTECHECTDYTSEEECRNCLEGYLPKELFNKLHNIKL